MQDIVGEFWKTELADYQRYLKNVDFKIHLFDVPLHYKLHEASKTGADFDLTTIFVDTLVHTYPEYAVTFVDNHDTQPNRTGEVWVDLTRTRDEHILIEEDGFATFFVKGGGVSIWDQPEQGIF